MLYFLTVSVHKENVIYNFKKALHKFLLDPQLQISESLYKHQWLAGIAVKFSNLVLVLVLPCVLRSLADCGRSTDNHLCQISTKYYQANY